MTTFLPGWRPPHIWEGAPLVAYKWSPKQCDKEAVVSIQVVYIISCQAFAPTMNDCIWSFSSQPLISCQWLPDWVDLVNKMPGANFQADCQVEVPTQGAKDLWGSEEADSSPSHSLSWSPAQRPPSGHPNVRYCLEIQVTLTEELGAIPPPSHSWTAPLVEDMLQEARTGLTEAVVVGPGRVVLFYGRHSMGECLKVDKARDAAFLPMGAGTWMGKATYLTANPMTI